LLVFAAYRAIADAALDRVLDESRYTSAEKSEIEYVFDGAEGSGIGVELLLPRVQEARAKRVPANRLISALRLEIERLEYARDILIEAADCEMLLLDNAGWQRTANLVAWQAEKEEIRVLAAACAKDVNKYLKASYLFTSLVEWGLDRRASLDLASAAAGSKIDIEEYPGIFEILIAGRRLKMQPHNVAERIIQALDDAGNLRQLRRKVLNDR
jgi:hypothetical protein